MRRIDFVPILEYNFAEYCKAEETTYKAHKAQPVAVRSRQCRYILNEENSTLTMGRGLNFLTQEWHHPLFRKSDSDITIDVAGTQYEGKCQHLKSMHVEIK